MTSAPATACLFWALALLVTPPLDLPALAGASPAAVVRALGSPRSGSVENPGPIVTQSFTAPGGQVTVTYCGGDMPGTVPQAMSFELRLDDPLPTSAALLTLTGLRADQVIVAEQGPAHVELGPTEGSSLVRALATRNERGWSTVTLDYAVPC